LSAHPALERFVGGAIKHRWPVLLVSLVLTGLAAWGMAEIDIYTSRKALLPDDVPVNKRLDNFLSRFGAASDLIVVLSGDNRPELEGYAGKLARKLEADPLIRDAMERVDLLFFLEHAYLMVPEHNLEQFGEVVDDLVGIDPPEQLEHWRDAWKRTETWLEDPPDLAGVEMDLKTAEESLHLVLFFLEQWKRWLDAPAAPKTIAWNTMLARHGAESLASGYFTSWDGKMLFVFVRPTETSEEFEKVKPLNEAVRRINAALLAEWTAAGHQPVEMGLTGIPAATFEEFLAIKRDILVTGSLAAGLIILLILAWLRSVRWALVVFVPMSVGVVLNVGLAYLMLGHMTILTSGFTAILFGLGVDYGIFMSTRIIEERRHQPDLLKAITTGSAASAKALLTAGGATFLIFLSLSFVEFRGFAELGQVAATGVGLVLISTFLLQPIFFYLLPPKVGPSVASAKEGLRTPALAKKRLKIPMPVNVFLVLAAVTAAALGGFAVSGIPFDYDVMSLLPKDSEAAAYQRRMLEESDYQGEMVIFTAPNIEQARLLSKKAAALPSISQVQGITDMFPPDAAKRAERARAVGAKIDGSEYAKRIRALGQIQLDAQDDARIDRSLEKITELIEDAQEQAFSAGHNHLVKVMETILETLEAISDKREAKPEQTHERTQLYVQTLVDRSKAALDVLGAWKSAKALTPDDLPSSLRQRFFGTDGSVAFYATPAGNIYKHQTLVDLMEQVYSVSPDATGFPTTHHAFSKVVVDSYRVGTLAAIVVALFWISLVLRRLRGVIIASLPLLIGGGWMMGLMSVSGMSFNFANLLGLPLVMGLAVDYGVWFAHRRRDFPDESGWTVARRAGKAILLAAVTTLAGLGAITLASYRGIASMGVAVTIGLISCVVAALLISPAITELLFRRKT
jgi:predicted RND superfamily exporter protein